ncbi:MAG: tetratricopeptide repeat protein [Actinobacteria bacterium]|nr:tetratricopeptide repeat protein [Actinomycetota bacterium]
MVLAVLLLHTNRPIGRQQIIDAVWGPAHPTHAVNLLQRHVSALRRVLEPQRSARAASDRVVWTDGGYLFTVSAGGLDLEQFDSSVSLARAARMAGDLPKAAAALHSALQLWRGPACDGLISPFLDAQREQLAERRISALEERIDLDLALGNHLDVIAELRALVAEYPLRERLRWLLMAALYRSGRQADALAAYQDARRQLRDEVGVAPAAALQRLQQQILAADPELAPPVSSGPITVSSQRKSRQQIPMPAQLPRDLSNFVGRDCELSLLNSLLSAKDDQSKGAGVTALVGMPGVGKTALAVHWAHQIRDQFSDGQVYLNLRGHDPGEPPLDPADALHTVLEAFGVAGQQIPAGLEARAALYRSLLAGQRVLIVLDNAHDAEQVRPLLPGSPGCQVILTSRTQLTSLAAIDGAQLLPLEPLSNADAQQLLARRLGAQRVAAEAAAVEQIVASCAGLPLALSIVAARAVPGFPLAAVADQLRAARGGSSPLDAFDAGDETANLRSVLASSYRCLSPLAARVFRLLHLLPGPDFASCVVAGLADLPMARVDAPLTELRRANLVTEVKPGVFALHEMLRAYAAELSLAEDSEEERRLALRGLSEHCLHPAHRADRLLSQLSEDHRTWRAGQPAGHADDLPAHREALDWFTAQHPRLRWALGPSVHSSFEQGLRQLAWTFESFLEGNDYPREPRPLHRPGGEHDERPHEPAGQAICHGCLAYAYGQLGRLDDAELHARQTLALYQELEQRIPQAHAYRLLSWVLSLQGRYREALTQAELAGEVTVRRALDLQA